MIEEIARKVVVAVKGITPEQAKQAIELKLANSTLGYRELGKRVNPPLKKDKVMQVWKMAEPMLALVKETSREPEKPRDEGEFYAEAFSTIEKLLKRGFKPADIVIELVKRFKILPQKSNTVVQSYFDQKRLNVIELEKKWRRKLASLQKRVAEIGALQEWADGIDADMQSLRRRVELSLSTGQRVEQLETDMMRVIYGLNRAIRNLNVVINTLASAGLMVKYRSIPELKYRSMIYFRNRC